MSQGQRANRYGSALFGVYRTSRVLKDGTTDQYEVVTDLLTFRNTKRDAEKIVREWQARDSENGSQYSARRIH